MATLEERSTPLVYILSCEMVCLHCARLLPMSAEERHKLSGHAWVTKVRCIRCNGVSDMWDMLMAGADLACHKDIPIESYQGKPKRLRRARERCRSEWGMQRRVRRMQELWRLREAQGVLALKKRLTKSQWTSLMGQGHIDIRGSDNRRYRLYFSKHSNIATVDRHGQPTAGWCYHAGEFISTGDSLLVQKLHIEMDAEGFFSAANPQREDWMEGVCAYADYKKFLHKCLRLIERAELDHQEPINVAGAPADLIDMDLRALLSAQTTTEATAAETTAETTSSAAETTAAEAAVAAEAREDERGNLGLSREVSLSGQEEHDESGVCVTNLDSADDPVVALA